MRPAFAAIPFLFSTSAMAGTFTSYTPVHVAPIIHVAPVHLAPVHVAPVVRPNPAVHVKPVVDVKPVAGPTVSQAHPKPRPITLIPVSQNASPTAAKCVDAKSGAKDCAKK